MTTFINIKDNLALCEVMEKTFKENIEPFYGNQTKALNKILAGIDRSCEIFCIKNKPIGLIVYKTALQNEFDLKDAFELKTTFIHEPHRNQGMGKYMFDHVYSKMAIIHDLPEIITGDQAYFHHMFNEEARNLKQQREGAAMQQLTSNLPPEIGSELMQLWLEYENQISAEAMLVKAIDKVEAQIQHNEADISVWNEHDKKHYKTYLNKFCDIDKALMTLRKAVQLESINKLAGATT